MFQGFFPPQYTAPHPACTLSLANDSCPLCVIVGIQYPRTTKRENLPGELRICFSATFSDDKGNTLFIPTFLCESPRAVLKMEGKHCGDMQLGKASKNLAYICFGPKSNVNLL